MDALYKQILASNKETGCTDVETLMKNSYMINQVKASLEKDGFLIKGLNDREISVLFFALLDILLVVDKDGSMTIVTLCYNKLRELYNSGRVIPAEGEQGVTKTWSVIINNNMQVINRYLKEKRFHFVKLIPLEECKNTSFICSVSYMKPYPTVGNGEKIYTMSDVASWHNKLYNALIQGSLKLKTVDGTVICQNYSIKDVLPSIPTSGELNTKTLDNTVISIPLWNIESFDTYHRNDLVRRLTEGVCTYKGAKITLNREILEKYYGAKILYTKLESKNVRMKYCLEELMMIGNNVSPYYLIQKYGLDFKCQTTRELYSQLIKNIKEVKQTNSNTSTVHVRVLLPVSQILSGKKSFYMTINLSSLEEDIIEVKDVKEVLPKEYTYSAISSRMGYTHAIIVALSESLALKNGETEFIRQFGDMVLFKGLTSADGNVLKGTKRYNVGINDQMRLCQSIMYGYKENFDSYAKILREVCEKAGVVEPTDDEIKFLFINQLAKKARDPRKVTLSIMSPELINLLDILETRESANKALIEELLNIYGKKALIEWQKIRDNGVEGFVVESTPKGEIITTQIGRYRLRDGVLMSDVDIFYNGSLLGRKRFK